VRVRLSARARLDLEEIGDWIAADDAQAAQRFVASLVDRCLSLAEHPGRCPVVRHVGGHSGRDRRSWNRFRSASNRRSTAVAFSFLHRGRCDGFFLTIFALPRLVLEPRTNERSPLFMFQAVKALQSSLQSEITPHDDISPLARRPL
jgi:plasmid stabilization system protein ParE